MEKGPDHSLGHGAVRDHPFPEGAHRHQVPGGPPQHLPGGLAHLQDLAGVAVHRHHRRLLEEDPPPPHGHQHRSGAQVHGDGPGKAPLSLLVHILAPLPVFVGEQSILQTKRGFPTNFGSCGSEECSLLGIALVLREGVPYGWVPLKLPRGATPRRTPGPGRGPGFLWKKAGGKNTRAERGSLRPGPASLWSEIRESFFLYSETGLRPCILRP